MTLLRRDLLLAAPALASVAGCASLRDKVNVAQVAADVNNIAGAFGSMVPQLKKLNVSGLTPQVVDTVGAAVSGLQAVAVQIATVSATAQAQPLVLRVETYVNAIVGVLAVLPLPPPLPAALQAAVVLLPIIEAGVGLLMSRKASGAPGGMDENQARLILRGLAVSY